MLTIDKNIPLGPAKILHFFFLFGLNADHEIKGI